MRFQQSCVTLGIETYTPSVSKNSTTQLVFCFDSLDIDGLLLPMEQSMHACRKAPRLLLVFLLVYSVTTCYSCTPPFLVLFSPSSASLAAIKNRNGRVEINTTLQLRIMCSSGVRKGAVSWSKCMKPYELCFGMEGVGFNTG